jgi:hypothetical protein
MPLARLIGCSSTPQVLGSTHHGSEFQSEVKKILSYVPHQSTSLRPGPSRWSFSHKQWCHCVKVGQGFEGFLDLREFFLAKCRGVPSPRPLAG